MSRIFGKNKLGGVVDPQTQKLIDAAKASGLPPVYTLPVDQARKRMHDGFVIHDEPIPVGKVEDIEIPASWGSMMCRVYTPTGDGPFPVFVFFHGGGWVVNSVETHDQVCRHIAKMSGCIVFSVEYRLAPETKCPGQIQDAYEATEWIAKNAALYNGDAERLAVGGDSSGGNQAASVCLMARDKGGPKIKYQVLIYPVTDYYEPGTQSYKDYATGFSLGKDMMKWFWDNYFEGSGASIDDPYVCPLRAKSLKGLPPALILTAEFDPLRDEAEEYARRLDKAGVKTKLTRYYGLMHGFIMQWRVLDKGMESLKEISNALKENLANK